MIQRQDEAQDWQTPIEFLELVREVFGGSIGLDPCTVAGNPTGAKLFYTPAEDGLAQPWLDRGGIFVNPPYGRGIGDWTRKMHDVGFIDHGVIGLIPARTDTAWWHRDIARADHVCFLRGRIRFVDVKTGKQQGAGKFPSAVPYWGNRGKRFREVFGKLGWIP